MKKPFSKKNIIPESIFSLRILLLIISLAWTVFIIWQSTNNAAESTEKSNTIVEAIKKIAEALGINITNKDMLPHYIRKCAHFVEFGILGGMSFLTAKAFKLKPLVLFTVAIGYCSLTALTDEYIQKFSEGRSGQISDVLLDIFGALFFILVLFTITAIHKKHKKEHKPEA